MNDLNMIEERAIKTINSFKRSGKITDDWSFRWNKRKSHLALCDFGNKTIQLSIFYAQIGSHEDINDSILHEVAHAIAGPDAGHGPKWKKVCREIGARPIRCGKTVPNMPSKYKGTCPGCGHIYSAHRKLSNMNTRLCGIKGCDAKRTKSYVVWKEQKC